MYVSLGVMFICKFYIINMQSIYLDQMQYYFKGHFTIKSQNRESLNLVL